MDAQIYTKNVQQIIDAEVQTKVVLTVEFFSPRYIRDGVRAVGSASFVTPAAAAVLSLVGLLLERVTSSRRDDVKLDSVSMTTTG